MNFKQNLHTHTTYVDGKDRPEEMVIEAINRGFDSIGFSEHSYVKFSEFEPQLKETQMKKFVTEVRELKEKYRDKIKIFCGMELDFFSDTPAADLDYIIGSVHYIEMDNEHYVVDGSIEEMTAILKEKFGGNGFLFAKKYYETVASIPQRHKVDIIGHFDLISKNIERMNYIDSNAKEYLNSGYEAIYLLKGKIPFFEVNTGAIARGYRTKPYPQVEFLKEFKTQGFGAVITSDCHDKNFLECHFQEARELLAQAGFKSRFVLDENGFKEVEL